MGLIAVLCAFGLLAVLTLIPTQFNWEVSSQSGDEVGGTRMTAHTPDNDLENYDIRSGASKEAHGSLAKIRESAGKNAAAVADVKDGFVRGEESLRQRVPTLKVEYSKELLNAEVIGPDVTKGRAFLTGPGDGDRVGKLRNFLRENNALVGVNNDQIGKLKVVADYTNPDGNLSYVHLEQEIGGVPVFQGEVKAGFTKQGEIVRVINNLAPALDYNSLTAGADFGDPRRAVINAAKHTNIDVNGITLEREDSLSSANKVVFGSGDWATTAERMYFPTEPGVAVPAWRVLIWQPGDTYYVIVDGREGAMLWRKKITSHQTQSATYQVYRNTGAMIDVADSPAPLSPGPDNPGSGTQGALLTRENVTLIGNETVGGRSYAFVQNGWINDGANGTDGNFVEAGIDRDGTNGVDAIQMGDGECPGAGCRVFTSTWNPPPGNPAPGDDPLTAQAQRGAVIQMFYVMNRYQAEMYSLGFTEAARNFQHVNFTGQGAQNDRVSAEGQDSASTNNANFGTPADGGRGRMQMFLWTGPTPDYDGTADAEVIIHEVTHGLSNRLHGNAGGLNSNMAGGMGEGWSDFMPWQCFQSRMTRSMASIPWAVMRHTS